MTDSKIDSERGKAYQAISLFLIILSVFFLIKIVHSFNRDSYMKDGQRHTITLTGHGEVQAVPDIATFYFTITKEAKTVKEAQGMVADVEKAAIDALKELGVEEKDIQATSTSFYPRYEYQSTSGARLSCNQWGCPPDAGKRVTVGYEASESITVKVRNLEDVGAIQQALGNIAVTNLNGPDFSIDDEEGLKAEARRKAIENAKEKAKVLAGDLGVRLAKIASFQENTGGFYPMYEKASLMTAEDSAGNATPAVLPAGENTISSDVIIVYEIR